MSMIFDRFPTARLARGFVAAVAVLEPELETVIFTSVAEAQQADPFPGELVPPIVHVERGCSSGGSSARVGCRATVRPAEPAAPTMPERRSRRELERRAVVLERQLGQAIRTLDHATGDDG